MEWLAPSGATLRLIQGDITRIEADAIVNAANSALAGGGGVDGAIHRAGGPSLMMELSHIRAEIGRCPTGKVVVTGAGLLKARIVIHAVGPVYRGGTAGEADLLASCYREALGLAADRSLTSIAFPAISTGVYGYPVEEAARIALGEIQSFLVDPRSIKTVFVVLFDSDALQTFERALRS